MPVLTANPSLPELQAYVAELEQDKGFIAESALQKCLLLGEEVGELFKAVRSATGIGVDPTRAVKDIAEELADVLIFVLALSNRFGIDLNQAFKDKQLANERRVWQSSR